MTVDTQPTVADLGRLVKAKYPVYGSVPDDELGRRVRAKYPAYQRFVDVPAPGASAQIAEIRARHPEPAPPSAAELAASREARFESGPPAMRALFQFGKAARQALPGFGETAGLEAVPPPSGGLERAASVAGGLAGFSAVALPITAATGGLGAAPLVAGAIGAGVAGAAAPGTLKERAARGGTMAASSAVLGKVLQSVAAALARNVVEKAPQIAAALRGEFRQLVDAGIRRGLPAEQATAEASAAIGAKMDAASRAAVNRVIRTREAASAVGGAATFGVVQPAAERYALREMGEQPQEPTTGDMVQSGLELLAVNLLTGGHAILRGAPEAKPGPARATAVEAPERGLTLTKPYEPVPGQIKAVQKRMEAEKAQAAGKPLTAPQEAAPPIQAQQPAPGPEVAPAPKAALPAENVARIAALTRQIEKNPGDKRVTKWQRRIADLGGVAPKPKVGRRPSGPGIPTEEPAPPTKPSMPQEERAAKLERLIAERPQDKNVKRWKARLAEIRGAQPTQPKAGAVDTELAPTVTPVAPAVGKLSRREPAAPAASEKSAAARIIVPNMEFGEEAAARRLATSIARDRPEAAPTVVKTRKGFQIEVNEEAGQSRLRKQTFAPAKPAPAAAPEPQPAARGEGIPVVSEGKGKGAVPEAVAAKRTFVEEFEDLARQGRSLRDATDQAMERSGAEPPAGLDLESRWNRVRKEVSRVESEPVREVGVPGTPSVPGVSQRVHATMEEVTPGSIQRQGQGPEGVQHAGEARQVAPGIMRDLRIQGREAPPGLQPAVRGEMAVSEAPPRRTQEAGGVAIAEQAKIARTAREQGQPWRDVAAEVGIREARVKELVDFAHMDQSVRETYFPSGNETGLLGSTVQGETVGRYARESPELMSPDVQRQWLDQAVNGGLTPAMFSKQLRQWHDALKALKQETIDLPGGGKGVKLAMTPKQFSETAGRLLRAIESQKRALADATSSLETVSEMAKGAGHNAAREFVDSRLAQVGTEGARLVKAKKEIAAAINATIARGGDVAAEFDKIQKRVDEILGNKALPDLTGEQGFVRIPDLMDGLSNAFKRLSGIVRRNPVAKQMKNPKPVRPAVVDDLLEAIAGTQEIKPEQEQMKSAEIARRLGLARERQQGLRGQERHRARRSAFAGRLPQPQFEGLRKALTSEKIDDLIEMVYEHPGLNDFEKDNAIDGLEKLLGGIGTEGRIPEPRELELLEIVFGPDLVRELDRLRPSLSSARTNIIAIGNLHKALRFSADLSAALAQGAYFLPSHPGIWGRAFTRMHRYFASEDAFRAGMDEIFRRKNAPIYRQMKLALTRAGGAARLEQREEVFISANLLQNVPIVRSYVIPSERAWVGFLNYQRAGIADRLIAQARRDGWRMKDVVGYRGKGDKRVPVTVADLMGGLVNAGTGRGNSQFITNNAELLNLFFTSPRRIASRLHLFNPANYFGRTRPGFLRREYIKDAALFAGAANIVLTLAGWAGGQIERDRLNADFGKVRVGNVVYDLLGGTIQYVRLFYELEQALWKSSRGEPVRISAAELLSRFAENKVSPLVDLVSEFLRGWKLGPHGKEKLTIKDLPREALLSLLPLVGEDFFQVLAEDPRQLPLAMPVSTYGGGVQIYPPPGQRHRGPQAPKAPHAPTAP